MIETHLSAELITLFALFAFLFVYWRDATKEGFSSDKILDSFFYILFGAFLGGKLLFRNIDVNYFKYNFWQAPLIFEGVLVGGALMFIYVVKKNKWSSWKLGDMIAPALALAQTILFIGLWAENNHISYLVMAFCFGLLYYFLRFLKKKKAFGSSFNFFELRRLNKPVVSGMLLAIYLTGSSLIAILFLAINFNNRTTFWWFQFGFYIVLLSLSYYLFKKRLKTKEIKMSATQSISNMPNKLKYNLIGRFKKIQRQKKELKSQDPFLQEGMSEGYRNVGEDGDEANDLGEYRRVQAVNEELTREEAEVQDAINKIEKGAYGICSNCGQKIDPKRLEIYPTANLCIKCEEKREKGRR